MKDHGVCNLPLNCSEEKNFLIFQMWSFIHAFIVHLFNKQHSLYMPYFSKQIACTSYVLNRYNTHKTRVSQYIQKIQNIENIAGLNYTSFENALELLSTLHNKIFLTPFMCHFKQHLLTSLKSSLFTKFNKIPFYFPFPSFDQALQSQLL